MKAITQTQTTELTRQLYISPMRERNEEIYGIDGCFCCYKPLKNDDYYYVHINIDMEVVNPKIVTEENCEELTGSESQGCFRVGNDCAKKMKGFVFKY